MFHSRLVSCLARGCFAALAVLFSVQTESAFEIRRITYHGWPEAFVISNGTVEAVVVPSLGRVMQFRFAGDEDGPFWENRELDGKSPNSQSEEWINFGGDKTWPSPQGEWAKITGRGWPPPKAFDSMPVEATIEGVTVVLRSKIDPSYGIRTERRITVAPRTAEMKIETLYRKVEGPPIQVGIWIITQLKEPERVFMPVPKNTLFPGGYNKQGTILPENLSYADGWVTCTRSTKDSTKIGSDASDLIWADAHWVVALHAPREKSGDFPDSGSSAEIYTNPDPKKYVELEMLGPLQTLKKSDVLSRTQTYRLARRTAAPLDQQVQKLVERK